MCGIFAAINMEGTFNSGDLERFEQLSSITNYRGPDSNNSLTFNSFQKKSNKDNFNIYLGHNRLSIIDLSSDGNQPFVDDGCYLIYNGEIFNYIELKKDLEKDGVVFKTKTDTEVILKIYHKYSETGFDLFNGMWAFIIYDSKKNKIVASRDRFSIKPIYYYKNKTSIFFASEIKQLIPLLDKKTINKNVLFQFLQQGLLDIDEDTFFEGIKRITSKSNFIINLENKITSNNNYWEFKFNEIDDINYLSDFRDLFFDSIKIRLRSDVEVGSLLSGGLDSSAISLVAENLTGGNLSTFSVVSNDKNSSEEKYIDILRKRYNIKNTKLFINHKDILDNLEKVIYHQDEPFSTLSVVAQYTILGKIKKHTGIKVVLSGQGGDELLMGYLKYYFFYMKDLANNKNFVKLSIEILLSLLNRTVMLNSSFSLSKRYIPFLMKKNFNYLKFDGEIKNTWKFNNLTERQFTDIEKYSVPILTRYEDRNSMAHSIETRLPFLDHRLVSHVLNLKNDLKIKNGWTKYILRKSINELPEKIRWRRDKKGFTIPEDIWFKNELKQDVFSLFQKSYLDKIEMIDKNLFLKYYDNFLEGSRNIHYSDISRVYIAEKWVRNLLS